MKEFKNSFDFECMSDEELINFWKRHNYDDFNPWRGIGLSSIHPEKNDDIIQQYEDCKAEMKTRGLVQLILESGFNGDIKTVLCKKAV